MSTNTTPSAGAARAVLAIAATAQSKESSFFVRLEPKAWAEIIDRETRAGRLAEALEGMINANGGVAVMPTTEARNQNAAIKEARAALAEWKENNQSTKDQTP